MIRRRSGGGIFVGAPTALILDASRSNARYPAYRSIAGSNDVKLAAEVAGSVAAGIVARTAGGARRVARADVCVCARARAVYRSKDECVGRVGGGLP